MMNSKFVYEKIHKATGGEPYVDLKVYNLSYMPHFHEEVELIYVVYERAEKVLDYSIFLL